MKSRFEPMTFGYDIMLNYQLFQKLKLIGRGKFNHLTITLTLIIFSFFIFEVTFWNWFRPCAKIWIKVRTSKNNLMQMW